MTRSLSSVLVLATFLASTSAAFPSSQEQPTNTSTPASQVQFPNTNAGLQAFLEEVRSASKVGDLQKLSTLTKQTEIPHDRDWFSRTYPEAKSETWIGPYEKDLTTNEEKFRQQFTKIGQFSGQFVIRKVNSDPQPGKGLEWAMLNFARIPLDLYFASWKPDFGEAEPIGYFIFIDGMFRWDSTVQSVQWPVVATTPKAQRGNCLEPELPVSGSALKVGEVSVTPPRVTYSVYPEYTEAAKKARIEGTVTLSLVVDVDGRAKNIAVVKSLGYGLDEQVVDALRCYRFVPATKDGQPVPVQINFETNFHLTK